MNETGPRNRITHLPAALLVAAVIGLPVGAWAADEARPGNPSGTPAPAAAAHGGHDEHGAGKEGEKEHHDEVKLTPEAVVRYGITVAQARKQPLRPTFTAPARVSYNTEAMAHVGSAVTGRVAQLKVKLGDTVAAGDPLLVVESPELGEAQSDYLLKRSALETAKSSIDLSRSAYERAKKLYEGSQGISLTEVQKREAELKAAEGAVRSAEAAATAAENRLHLFGMDQGAVQALAKSGEIDPRYTIRAPIAGQVVEREVTLGELVRPERDALLVLADLDTLWVMADVPEARLGQVRVGSEARVRVGALGSEPIEGKVSYIAAATDPTTRSAKVRIAVKNGTRALRPGMFAQAEIAAAAEAAAGGRPVLAIPEEAVQNVEGEPAVFVPVPNEEHTFAKRPVTVGKAVGGMVPVLAGLTEGQPLVVKGSFILKADLGKSAAAHED
jgi:cobalt-zinc-cadmium efflux system membrane fusion protein